jgi:hypothetical protein
MRLTEEQLRVLREALIWAQTCVLIVVFVVSTPGLMKNVYGTEPTCGQPGYSKQTIQTSLFGAFEQESYNITFLRMGDVVIAIGGSVSHKEAKTLESLSTTAFELPAWAMPRKHITDQNGVLSAWTPCNRGVCEVVLRAFYYYDVPTMQIVWLQERRDPPNPDRYAPLMTSSFTTAWLARDSEPKPVHNSM